MAARVAKTIALLEFVRDVPRTEGSIAAWLKPLASPHLNQKSKRSRNLRPANSNGIPRRDGTFRPLRRKAGKPSVVIPNALQNFLSMGVEEARFRLISQAVALVPPACCVVAWLE